MNGFGPWLALAGLGAFHGLNPAMGWLFAVALGMHRGSRRVVLLSLVPIALGHALAIAAVVGVVVGLGSVIDERSLRLGGGAVLVGWAVYHATFGRRHRVRVGMRTGLAGLGLWSFLMATAHGAGLMLIPVLVPMLAPSGHHSMAAGAPLAVSLAAVGVHTLALLTVTGTIALAVYEWIGLGFLRRGWVNLDVVWTLALLATGVVLMLASS